MATASHAATTVLGPSHAVVHISLYTSAADAGNAYLRLHTVQYDVRQSRLTHVSDRKQPGLSRAMAGLTIVVRSYSVAGQLRGVAFSFLESRVLTRPDIHYTTMTILCDAQ